MNHGTDISHCLYGRSGSANRPADLGYWTGYKISEAYYKNAADKRQTINDMLIVKDWTEFLSRSRYREKFVVNMAS